MLNPRSVMKNYIMLIEELFNEAKNHTYSDKFKRYNEIAEKKLRNLYEDGKITWDEYYKADLIKNILINTVDENFAIEQRQGFLSDARNMIERLKADYN